MAKTKHCYGVQHARTLNVNDSIMSRGALRVCVHTRKVSSNCLDWLNGASPVGVLRECVF